MSLDPVESQKIARALRFKILKDLEETFREIFNQVAAEEMREMDVTKTAQRVMQARNSCVKLLINADEMEEYQQLYPEVED
ncbi:MAG: hypothetical protein AAGB01_08685 [Cyanobacteria bacterium P01_F01_bin.42]